MQHGEEVQCIPFTTSPFSDVARNLPWSHAVINEALKFTPSSLKVKLVGRVLIIQAASDKFTQLSVLSLSRIVTIIYRQV